MPLFATARKHVAEGLYSVQSMEMTMLEPEATPDNQLATSDAAAMIVSM